MRKYARKLSTACALVIGLCAMAYPVGAAAPDGGNGGMHAQQSDASQTERQGEERHARVGLRMHPAAMAAKLLGLQREDLLRELAAGKSLARIAKDKAGWSETQLIDKLVAAGKLEIDGAVKAGTLTREQADQQLAALPERMKAAVNRSGPPPMHRHHHHGGKGHKLRLAAEALGMTPEELRAELAKGRSIAEVAKSLGISEKALIAKLKDGMTDHLKRWVEHKHPAEKKG